MRKMMVRSVIGLVRNMLCEINVIGLVRNMLVRIYRREISWASDFGDKCLHKYIFISVL